MNYHYTHDIVEKEGIKVDFIPSNEMVIDPMTKGLSLDKFREHLLVMGFRNI